MDDMHEENGLAGTDVEVSAVESAACPPATASDELPAAAIAAPRTTFKMELSFDGTAYHGWQRQPNGITV